MAFDCQVCHFSLWLPIAELETSYLGLYDDNRFPGRSILSVKAHFDDLEDMPATMTCAFLEEAKRCALAIKRATGAARINYAILGNAERHVHCHLVPRFPAQEPSPRKSPWDDPRAKGSNLPTENHRLVEAIRDELGVREHRV